MSKTVTIEVLEAGAVAGVDWDSKEWIGNGTADSAYTEKYKVIHNVKNVVNIQQPVWEGVTGPGIYMECNAGISECTLGTGTDKTDFYIQGAGILLYMSGFTAKETSFTVTDALGTYDVTVFYADGTDSSEASGE